MCSITYSDGLFTGRVSDSLLSWPLASSSARVSGLKATATIVRPSQSDMSSFAVFLDGQKAGDIPPNSSSIIVHLGGGTHNISLVKSNEAMYGEAVFPGFKVEDGTVEPFVASPRRIEIIGDSISTGYGDLGPNAYCAASASNEDSTLSYGFLAAKALDAQINLIAYSGKGMYRNYDLSLDETMPTLWSWRSATNPIQWNTSEFLPDVVLINLGTNDFAHGIDVVTQFRATYLTFLQTLRSSYPSASILIAIGPLVHGETRNVVLNTLREVMAESNVGGLDLLDFGEQTVDSSGNGAACEYHPSLKTQREMSVTLESAIRQKTGWK